MPEGYQYALVANAGRTNGTTVRWNETTHRYEPAAFPSGEVSVGELGATQLIFATTDAPADLTDLSVALFIVYLGPGEEDPESGEFVFNLPEPPPFGSGRSNFQIALIGWNPGLTIHLDWPSLAEPKLVFGVQLAQGASAFSVAFRCQAIGPPLSDPLAWQTTPAPTLQALTGMILVTPAGVDNGEGEPDAELNPTEPMGIATIGRSVIGIDCTGITYLNTFALYNEWQSPILHLMNTEDLVGIRVSNVDGGGGGEIEINQALLDSMRQEDTSEHIWFRLHIGNGYWSIDPVFGPQHIRNPVAVVTSPATSEFTLGKWAGFRIAPPIGVQRIEMTADCEFTLPNISDPAPPPPTFRVFFETGGFEASFDAGIIGTFIDAAGVGAGSGAFTANRLMEFTCISPSTNGWMCQILWSA